ncbi:MAG: phosphatidylserine decarboxylase family protein [Bacteroidota bacterium]|nr:phosphatidylserine decarboxylase family protein [Bacteroidota bacterium]MDE2957956.1 phosphatidylserine decarboxylase family protein [Bacteroidota bacterium]
MFAREGYMVIAVTWLVVAVIVVAVWLVPGLRNWIRVFVTGATVIGLGLFVLYFFRDPARTPPPGAESLLLSPADGKVIAVEAAQEPFFPDGQAQRVSIFLSVLDVHVNRAPADGVIDRADYIPGGFLFAWHPKASEENERSSLGLVHPTGQRVVFNQVAGGVARRIAFHLVPGDSVSAGQRYGIIRFGSRLDVYVSPSVPLFVRVGDRVRAGETVLGRLDVPIPGIQ